jgi:hypothetical protein
MSGPTRSISGCIVLSCLFCMAIPFPAIAQALAPGRSETDITIVPAGTRILLRTKNSLSTSNARIGDSFYAIVDYPVIIDKKVVIPADSLIRGIVADVQQGGRVRGRAQITINLEQLMLINGIQKPIDAEILSVDARAEAASVQRGGRIQAPGTVREDARVLVDTGSQGAFIGAIAGGGKGLAIGSAAGALAGLAIVLSTRGHELELDRGVGIELVLRQPLEFSSQELDFSSAPVMPSERNDADPGPRPMDRHPASCYPPYWGWPAYWYPIWIHFH